MKEITVEELKKKADAGDTLYILDVREPHEYAEANIGAKLIPIGAIQSMQVDDLEPYKNEELIIHCRSGVRSLQACNILQQMGFTNTVNVKGGILAWMDKYGNEKISSAIK